MRSISKTDTRSQATAYGKPAVFLSLPFLAMGGYFALAGFGVLPLHGKANAPLWVIGFVGLAFFTAGTTLLFHGSRGLFNRRRMRRAGERHFSEPWFVDHPWDPRGIRDQAGRRVLNGLLGLVLIGVLLVPFNWWAFISDAGGWFIGILVGIFDLVWLLIFGATGGHLIRLLRFGHTRLHFRRFPFHPGDRLQVALAGTRLARLKATLRFVEERWETRGSGSNRSTRLVSYEHYDEHKEVAAPSSAPEIEIDFPIPDNGEWTTTLSGKPVRYWELVVESEQPGVDFRTTFPLPIYPRP